MKKNLLIMTSLLLFLNCKKENGNTPDAKKSVLEEKYVELINDTLIYGLINSESLNEKSIIKHCENLIDRKTLVIIGNDTSLLKKVDTLFSVKDKEFILKQYHNGLKFTLNQKLVKYKNVVKYDTTMIDKLKSRIYWDKMIEKYHCIASINVPLFNLKKDMAIVELSYSCGAMCAERGIFVYKLNKNGKWELYQTIEKWIT